MDRDINRDRFSFQRQGSLNPSSELPVGAPLASPDQVNRTRFLQELIESGALTKRGDLGSDAFSLEAESSDLERGEFGIDDLFQRSPSFRGESGRTMGGDAEQQNRDGGASRTGNEADGTRGLDRDRDRDGLSGTGESSGGMRDSANDPNRASFLPGMDLRGNDFLNGTSRSRPGDSFLGNSRLNSGRMDRDAASDALRARQDSVESLRRMLNGSAPGSPSDPAGRAAGMGLAPGRTGVPGPVDRAGATGALRPAAVENPAIAPLGVPGLDGRGMARDLGEASRPVELNLGLGRERQSGSGSLLEPAPVRPMELFQKKHDSRLPSRVF